MPNYPSIDPLHEVNSTFWGTPRHLHIRRDFVRPWHLRRGWSGLIGCWAMMRQFNPKLEIES